MSQELVKLSPSKLGRFLQCPACFWREYHKKMPPSFPLPGVLGRMDALTKTYYDDYRGKTPPSVKGQITEKLVDAETAEIVRGWIKYSDEKLNAVLLGKMDDCMIDSSGRLVPIDNKTASPSNESLMEIYQVQLDAYTYILQKNGYKTADYGYLIYYVPVKGTPDKGIIFEATVKKISLKPGRIAKLFADAVELVRQPKPPKTTKDCTCEMCLWMGDE
jgi:CRISPR/Cas system-associated exonuclease Cas4 (RecB family)